MPPPHSASSLRPFPSSSSSSSSSSSVSASAPAGMFKNQLQELAQRSCFNLPSYSCIREGPDHAPRFKATVSFNGEVFESPGYHTTLRQAEHAAAEVALSSLSQRGPTQSLAARILDETGVCKNLLQETAQRAGVSLPVYTTIRSGPKHLPLFKCMVEVGGRRFMGEPAKTKKQAEKNAALAAWSALKQLSTASHPSFLLDCVNDDDAAEKSPLPHVSSSSTSTSTRPRPRTVVTVRDKSRAARDGFPATQVYAPFSTSEALSCDRISGGQYPYHHQQCGVPATSGDAAGFEAGQRYHYPAHSFLSGGPQLEDAHFRRAAAAPVGGRGFYSAQASSFHKGAASRSRQSGGRHQRRHSLSGMESPANAQDVVASSIASGGGSLYGGNRLYHQQQHLRIRGLPYQSLSDRFDLNRSSLLEELQQRDEEEERMMRKETTALPSSSARPQHSRSRMQSQSERFDYSNYLPQLDEDCGGRGAEEWSARDCLIAPRPTSSSFNGIERENCYTEGWLRGETLRQRLEEQKRHGYKEGWLRGEVTGHGLMSEERAWSQAHSEAGSSTSRMLSEAGSSSTSRMLSGKPSNGSQVQVQVHGGGWPQGSDMAAAEERLNGGGLGFRKDAQRLVDEETVYSAVAAAVASPSAQSQSHLSSLWSKSAQWWGSRMAPLSPSSAAAAIANTLGLRPASNVAPAVRVRHMVPVCSAPPPRRAATNEMAPPQIASLHHHLLAEGAPQLAGNSMESAAAAEGLGQLFNKLRM